MRRRGNWWRRSQSNSEKITNSKSGNRRFTYTGEIKQIREILHLTQLNASEIFGGGVNAFSRYERGETPIPRPLSQLLQILKNHPKLLIEINRNHSKSNLKNGANVHKLTS